MHSLVAPEILPGLAWSGSSDDDEQTNNIPMEVTILDADLDIAKESSTPKENTKVNSEEVQEYLRELQDTRNLTDQLTTDLQQSKNRVAVLMKQNASLLEKLKEAAGNDNATMEEHRMMKQELYTLKAALFCGAVWIWFGGRADVIGIVAFVWILADVLS